MSLCVSAQAATIYVPDDYLTIQEAANGANSGDIIIVRNGTHTIENILTIPENITLTIEPGTVIKVYGFYSPNSKIIIGGTLKAIGTEEGKIVFTHLSDDEYGGDTNNDGNSSSYYGSWGRISFTETSIDSELENVILRYGGGFYSSGSSCSSDAAGIRVEDTSITLTNSILEHNKRNGLLLINSSSTIDNVQFLDTVPCIGYKEYEGNGISIVGSASTVKNSLFKQNVIGIEINQLQDSPATPVIENNIFEENEKPIEVTSSCPFLKNNQAINNSLNGVLFYVGIDQNCSWQDNLTYVVYGILIIPENITLTIEPGTVIKVYSVYSANSKIIIEGTLKAIGTEEDKIVFTTLFDDEYGGDTNNDGNISWPYHGRWGRISFTETSTDSELENIILRYGGGFYSSGSSCSSDAAGIRVEDTPITLRNSILEHNKRNGLLLINSSSTIDNVQFLDTVPCIGYYEHGGDGISIVSAASTVKNSLLEENIIGVRIYGYPNNNYIYLNNFINNQQSVFCSVSTNNTWNFPEQMTYTYDGNTYTNYLGNYWDDYTGLDGDGDGIGDIPYIINGDNDSYPLIMPFENYIGLTEPNCSDNIKNQDETDIDCGGSCPGCEDGKSCLVDGDCISGYCGLGEVCLEAAKPVITSPLEITPNEDIYYVGDTINAEFIITNEGTKSITFDVLTVGGRLNGWCPNGGCPDFTFRNVSINTGESYNYQENFIPNQAGSYHFFVAYYIDNPTPDEKRLLDENNWNTVIHLDEGLTHADRIENIVVMERVNISELRDRINRRLYQEIKYPPYLPDPDSFTNAVASLWTMFTSWITQTDLIEKYDEFYQTGIDYDNLRFKSLIHARDSLDRNDTTNAENYLNRSYVYEKLSWMSFTAAAEVYADNLEVGEILAEGIKDGCEASVKFGLAVTNPQAAKAADYIYIGVDYIINLELVGEEEATKEALKELLITVLFNEVEFEVLDGRTISDYTTNKIGKFTFPILQDAFKNEELQFVLLKIIKQTGIEIEEELAEEVIDFILSELEKGVDLKQIEAKSPVEVRIHDFKGEVTGLLNGEVKHGISRSLYNNGTATVYFPNGSHEYELKGTDNGTYGLDISSIEDGEFNDFGISNVSIKNKTVHNYIINWSSFSQDGKIILRIDSDGDGVFEENVTIQSPVANFTYSPMDAIVNETITFNASSSYDLDGDIVAFEWYFGDGKSEIGEVVTHSYSSATDYDVTLIVMDNDGAVESITKEILITVIVNLTLNQGWNLISIPLQLINSSINYTFNNINPIIFGYKNNSFFIPEEIDNKLGYWLKTNESLNLTLIGTEVEDKTITLNNGWNLIGYPYINETDINNSDLKNYTTFAYINNSWLSYNPNKSGFLNRLKKLIAGYGYWVKK